MACALGPGPGPGPEQDQLGLGPGPEKWPGTFFKKHVPGNITCPKWTIQAFPRFLVKKCKYHPSSSNDYHCENRTEILCKYPCRTPWDVCSRPAWLWNFWKHRTLAWMSTWMFRGPEHLSNTVEYCRIPLNTVEYRRIPSNTVEYRRVITSKSILKWKRQDLMTWKASMT